MKKKEYNVPKMRVVKLKHCTNLLQDSGPVESGFNTDFVNKDYKA